MGRSEAANTQAAPWELCGFVFLRGGGCDYNKKVYQKGIYIYNKYIYIHSVVVVVVVLVGLRRYSACLCVCLCLCVSCVFLG